MNNIPTIWIADPPLPFKVWSKDTGSGRSAESHYRTMTWQDLYDLQPLWQPFLVDGAGLAMWCSPPQLELVLDMVHLWGWQYKSVVFSWLKLNKRYAQRLKSDMSLEELERLFKPGLGYGSRSNVELVLWFTAPGKTPPPRLDKGIRSWIFAPIGRHSEKPDEAQHRLRKLYSADRYVELFARREMPGWICSGLEAPDHKDVREFLINLAAQE